MTYQLHDVGLVHTHDPLSAVLEGKVERKARDSLGSSPSRNLERLDDARVGRVLQTRILSLGVLSHNDNVDVLVTCGEAGEGLAEGE